ncbi:MAG: hypothetical protein ACO37W_15715 [Prochlorotrichaceae cyanobacterium]
MLRLKRRNFLRSAALGLMVWGWDGLFPLASRYGRALAQPARQKFALLVGINSYDKNRCGCQPLAGCVTDVDLQHQLLAYRFGFRWENIYTLVNGEATRAAIETTFLTQLLPQVQPDDLVVIHFSGYGSTISVADQPPQPSLVTIDSLYPDNPEVPSNDLPKETLRLLIENLATRRVVTVLDTSFDFPPSALLRSAAQIRTRPHSRATVLAAETLALQDRLHQQLAERGAEGLSATGWPGLLLSAAASDQAALELKGDHYTAGVFTTCLTRQLWQAVPAATIYIDVQRLQNRTAPIVWQTQTPRSESSLGNTLNLKDLGVIPTLSQGLEGVITNISSDRREVELWLGGLSNAVLRTYGVNAALRIARYRSSDPEIVLQIVQRDRFSAKARVIAGAESSDRLFVGQGIQEKIRLLPQNTKLIIALADHLDRIERVDATSAFAGLQNLKVLSQDTEAPDYVFKHLGRVEETGQAWNSYRVIVEPSRYGLAAPGQDILPGTASAYDEAVKTAVQRLESRFNSLLAIKLLNLLENAATTHVPLTLQITNSSGGDPLVDYRAERALDRLENSVSSNSIPLVNLGVGQSLRYQIGNLGDRSLYGVLLAYEPNGSFSVGYPEYLIPGSFAPLQNWDIAAQQTAILEGILPGLTPEISLVLILSRAPLYRTLATIGRNVGGGISILKSVNNPLAVLQALVQDLQQASSTTWADSGRSDAIALDMSAWAALRLTGQIRY